MFFILSREAERLYLTTTDLDVIVSRMKPYGVNCHPIKKEKNTNLIYLSLKIATSINSLQSAQAEAHM